MAKRRTRNDSVAGQVQARRNLNDSIEVPDGVRIETDEAKTLWDQLTSARERSDWRQLDLWIIGKIVGYELDIREQRIALSEQGLIIENNRGTKVTNPLVNIIDNY